MAGLKLLSGDYVGKVLCFTVPKNYAVRDSDMRPLSANSEFGVKNQEVEVEIAHLCV